MNGVVMSWVKSTVCTKVLGVMGEHVRVGVGGFAGVNIGVGLGGGESVLMGWPVGVTHCSLVGDIGCLLFTAKGFVASSFFAIVGDKFGGVVGGGLVLVVLVVVEVVVVVVTSPGYCLSTRTHEHTCTIHTYTALYVHIG